MSRVRESAAIWFSVLYPGNKHVNGSNRTKASKICSPKLSHLLYESQRWRRLGGSEFEFLLNSCLLTATLPPFTFGSQEMRRQPDFLFTKHHKSLS